MRNFGGGLLAEAAMVGLSVAGGAPEHAVAQPASVAAGDVMPAPLVAQPFDIGAKVVPLAIENHPYDGPGAAEMSGGSRQQCKGPILRPSHLDEARMTNPGTVNESIFIKFSLGGVEGCDNWQRLAKARTQVKRDGEWMTTSGALWISYLSFGGDRSNEAQEGTALGFSPASREMVARCVNGHWEPTRVQSQNSMRNARTGKVAEKGKIKNWPVPVPGSCKQPHRQRR